MVPLRKGAHFESRTYVLQCLCEYCHSKDFIFAYSMLTLITQVQSMAHPSDYVFVLDGDDELADTRTAPHHLCFPPPFDLYSVLYYIFAAPTILLHPTAAGRHHLCCISTPSFVLHPSHFRYSSTIYPLVVAITRLRSLEIFALLYEQIFPIKAWFLWGKHNGKYSEQCRDLQKER